MFKIFISLLLLLTLQSPTLGDAGDFGKFIDCDYSDKNCLIEKGLDIVNSGGHGFIHGECVFRYFDVLKDQPYSDDYNRVMVEKGWSFHFSISCGRESPFCNHSSECVFLLEHIDIRPDGLYVLSAG